MHPLDGPLRRGRHVFMVGDVKQSYEVVGEGPVCVVHSGGPGINSDYLRIPHLEDHLTMVYLDPVGTSESGFLPDGKYFMSEYARFLDAVLDHVGIPRPIILGHSHGGMVALEVAVEHSHRLGGLIAYDTAPVYTDELWIEAARQMTAYSERWPDRPEAAAAARAWRAGANSPRTDAAAEQKFLADVLPAYFADSHRLPYSEHPPELNITWDPNRINGTWSARGRLGMIDTPTLIICGRFDFVCPPRWSREIHDAIPNSELCELLDSGHFGHLEQPKEFLSAVLGLIGRRR